MFRKPFAVTLILFTFLLSTVLMVNAQGGWLLPEDTGAAAPVKASADEGSGWLLPGNTPVATPKRTTGWLLPDTPAQAFLPNGDETVRPSERNVQPLFRPGAVVVSGFSGARFRVPFERPDLPKPDKDDPRYRFIDLDGVSVELLDPTQVETAYDGSELQRRPYDKLLSRDVGQVFGVATDVDETPGLYLGATSSYGLPIIGDDTDKDGVPDRLFRGLAEAQWMPGLWGADIKAGPGSIWRVDGGTGQVRLFANVRNGETENAGPGLGAIAWDAKHDQIFVSDLDFGTIHRFDVTGVEQQVFDHGVTALPLAGREAVPDDGTQADITQATFDPGNADTWGMTQKTRRVRGMTVHGGRLWYAVAQGADDTPEIWSVGIDKDTGALGQPQFEVAINDQPDGNEISDIDFGPDGQMLVSARPPVFAEFSFDNFVPDESAEVLRYAREYPEDTKTPELWEPIPAPYTIGFAKDGHNSLGGVALGPEIDEEGRLATNTCRETLWASGERLRNRPDLRERLEVGGSLPVDGLQYQPYPFDSKVNTPPWQARYFDYDGKYPDEVRLGHIGDVDVVGCNGDGQLFGERYVDTWNDYDPENWGYPDGGGNTGGGCMPGDLNCDGVCTANEPNCDKTCDPAVERCDPKRFLKVTKTCEPTEENYNFDDDALCTVTVQYRGPTPTSSSPIVVNDALTQPATGWTISGTSGQTHNWDCNAPVSNPPQNAMTCKIWDAREPGQNWSNWTSSYQYYVTAGDEFVNCATGKAGTSTDRACYHFGSKADLEISKTAETKYCTPGQVCYFNITVRNIGTGAYNGAINLNDSMSVAGGTFPSGNFVSVAPNICSNPANLNSLAGCNDQVTLLPGAAKSYRIGWVPTSGVSYGKGTHAQNCVALRDAAPLGRGAKRDCATVIIEDDDFELDKKIVGECVPGQDCTFEITLAAGSTPINGRYSLIENFAGGTAITSITSNNPVLPGVCQPLNTPFACVLDVNIPANTTSTITVTAKLPQTYDEAKNCVSLTPVSDQTPLGPIGLSSAYGQSMTESMPPLPVSASKTACVPLPEHREITLEKRCERTITDIAGANPHFICEIVARLTGAPPTAPVTITDFPSTGALQIVNMASPNATCQVTPTTQCTISPAQFAAAGNVVRIRTQMSGLPNSDYADAKNCATLGQPGDPEAICVPVNYPEDPELDVEKICETAVVNAEGGYDAACEIIVRGTDLPFSELVQIKDFTQNIGQTGNVSLTLAPQAPVICNPPSANAAPDVLCQVSANDLMNAGGEVRIPVTMSFTGAADGLNWQNCANAGLYRRVYPSGQLTLNEEGPESCVKINFPPEDPTDPELEVAKTCSPGEDTPTGWILNCTITVTGSGLAPGGTTKVRDDFTSQAGTVNLNWNGPSGPPINCAAVTSQPWSMECDIANAYINSNSPVVIPVTAFISPRGEDLNDAQNCASATADGGGAAPFTSQQVCVPLSNDEMASLVVSKTCNAPQQVAAGHEVDCVITVRGTNLYPGGQTTITDDMMNLPANRQVTLTALAPAPFSCSSMPGGSTNCTVGNDYIMAQGGTVSLPFKMTVAPGAQAAVFDNCAGASSTSVSSPGSISSNLVCVPIDIPPEDNPPPADPEISVVKTCEPAIAYKNEVTVNCVITVTGHNLISGGRTTINDMVQGLPSGGGVQLTSPAQAPYSCQNWPQSAGFGMMCSVDNDYITAQGGTVQIPFVMTTHRARETYSFENCGEAISGSAPSDIGEPLTVEDGPSCVPVDIPPVGDPMVPELKVDKSCAPPRETGDGHQVDCVITVTGTNLDPTGQTVVTDDMQNLPAGRQVTLTTSAQPPAVCTPFTSGTGINCTLGNNFIIAQGGTVGIPFTMTIAQGSEPAVFDNCGSAAFAGSSDTAAGPACVPIDIPPVGDPMVPELKVDKSCAPPRETGDGHQVDCVITVTGTNLDPTGQTVVTDDMQNLPAGRQVTLTTSAQPPAVCTPFTSGTGINCTLGNNFIIAQGGTVGIPFTMTIAQGSEPAVFDNCGSAAFAGSSDTAAGPACVPIDIPPVGDPGIPELRVDKSCVPPRETDGGYQVDCQLTVTGANLPAGDVISFVERPANLNGIQRIIATPTPPTTCTSYNPAAGNMIECQISAADLMAQGGTVSVPVTLAYTANPAGDGWQNCVSGHSVSQNGAFPSTQAEPVCVDITEHDIPLPSDVKVEKTCEAPTIKSDPETGGHKAYVKCNVVISGQQLQPGGVISLRELSNMPAAPGGTSLGVSGLPCVSTQSSPTLGLDCTITTDQLIAAGGRLAVVADMEFPVGKDPQTWQNCASVADAGGLGFVANPQTGEESCVNVTAVLPDDDDDDIGGGPILTLGKTATGDCAVNKAAQTYACGFELSVTNTGSAPWTGPLVLDDQFGQPEPRDAQVTGGDLNCTSSGGGGVSCLAGALTLAPGQSVKTQMELTIPGLPNGGSFENCIAQGFGDSTFQQVSIVQTALNALGIDGGPVDGLPGPKTTAATKELQTRVGMEPTGEITPELLARLGLSPSSQSKPVCVTVDLPPMPKPPLVCDAKTSVLRDGACVCRYKNMYQRNKTSCGCVKGYKFGGKSGCIKPKPKTDYPKPKKKVYKKPRACDAATTVRRGSKCACRYSGMVRRSATSCSCAKGSTFVAGKGCVKQRAKRECPKGAFNVGGVCVRTNLTIGGGDGISEQDKRRKRRSTPSSRSRPQKTD